MDASFHIKPFAFDRDFALATARRDGLGALDLEMEVESLQAEIERMKLDHAAELALARTDGFEAGLAHSRSDLDVAVLAAVDAMHASLENIDEQVASLTRDANRQATQVALAAADLMAARAIAHAPEAAIGAALGRVLEQVGRGPRLQIRVNASLVERMEQLIAERTSRERRRMTLTVIADDALPVGDAFIFWDEGGLALDAAARRAAVVEELGSLLSE